MEIPQFPVDVHGGARGSGLPITAIRAVTPSMQVKASILQLSEREGFGWRGAAYTCRRPDDASNCYYSLISVSYVVPNVQPTSLPALHYFLSCFGLPFISLSGRHLMGNLSRIRRISKSSSRFSLLQSLPLNIMMFFV